MHLGTSYLRLRARAGLSQSNSEQLCKSLNWPKLPHLSLASRVLNQQTQVLQKRGKKSKSSSFLNAFSRIPGGGRLGVEFPALTTAGDQPQSCESLSRVRRQATNIY